MELDGIEFEVSYRKVRYARVEMKAGRTLIILPPGNDPKIVLERHKKWIVKKKDFFDECKRNSVDKHIPDRTEAGFRELALSLISRFSRELGVTVNKVSFRSMRSRWGSCIPQKGNISLSNRLRYLSDRLLEYIVFHEVAHLVEKKHDPKFRKLISEKFGDYREFDKELISYQFKMDSMGPFQNSDKGCHGEHIRFAQHKLREAI